MAQGHVRGSRSALVALVALVAPAEALAATDVKPLAEALFQDARDLMAAGETHEACRKFAASQKIEPKLGTLLNLAACHEVEGKTASAWAEFTEAAAVAARSNQAEREEYARQHVTDLAPRLARIVLAAEQALEVRVLIDDVEIDRAALGTSFPADPGEHELTVSAPGRRSWTLKLIVAAGPSLRTIHVPALAADVAPAPAPGPLVDRPSTRTPGWILLGVGAAALGAGTYFGLRALSKNRDGELQCDGAECSQHGLDLFDDARRSATASDVAFGVGLVAVGVGAYLVLRPVATTAPRPTVSASRVGIALRW